MARIAKKAERYPSDLTDDERDRIAPMMPTPGRRGGSSNGPLDG